MPRLLARKLVLTVAAAIACGACATLPASHGGSTLFGPIPAASGEEDEPQIQPDQPDHTNAAYTVPPSLVQLEVGGQWTHVGSRGDVVQTPASVRAGIAPWFEVRTDTSGVVVVKQDGGATTQFSGLAIGGKFRVWATPGGMVLAVAPEITVPWGRGANGGTDALLSLLTGRDVNDRIHVDGEWAMASLSLGTADRFTQHLLSLSTSVSATRNWQPYTEVYWYTRTEPGGAHFLGIDAGVTYYRGYRASLDVAVDTSLSDSSVRPALLFGLSVILGEVAGHHGVAARMREAQRRGDR
ncbi:MAG: hypothetical protein ACM3NQ_13360 [Bacteroidales bacterium]